MEDSGLSGKPLEVSTPAIDDIPEALRDRPEEVPPQQPRQRNSIMLVGLAGVGAIALGIVVWFASQAWQPSGIALSPVDSSTSESAIAPEPEPTLAPLQDDLLGHLPYETAPLEDLVPIVDNGTIKLRKAAAERFNAMADAAWRDGIYLVPISGFRTLEDQEYLFFEVKAQRGQVAPERAEVSAPPGYSEHHTGYAVDIGDGDVPATNLSPHFEKTAAFKWLEANAAYYSFELSFPPNNAQGVSYEPWHWRFVGDRHSLETFYKARDSANSKPQTFN